MPASDEDVIYGLLTLAGMDVALPLAALREVVPCPLDLAGLPAAAPGLLGAMNLRTLVLPVLDLRPVIGRLDARSPDQVVVVVAHGGHVLGLLADSVRGITQVASSALLPMTADGGELLFSHTFRHPSEGTVVSVLDAAAVLRRPGVPTVADVTSGSTAISGAAGALARRGTADHKLTLLRCGSYVLGLDVAQVHTTLPAPTSRPSVLASELCRGVTDFVDREVPVVDPLVLLGLGKLSAEDTGAGLVLDYGQGYVVLALSELLDLTELAATDVLPLPAFAVHRPDLLAGMAAIEDVGQCLVLDGAALLAEPELGSLAWANTAVRGVEAPAGTPPAGTTAVAAVGTGRPYLTYSAGGDVATPLEQVVEILPFPAAATSTEAGGPVLGVVVHRRAAVPVVCLATLLGRTSGPVTAASCVLLVAVEGEHFAFAIDGLRAIDRLSWSDPDASPCEPSDDPSRLLHASPLVQIGTETRLLPDLDLQALARILRAPAAGAVPLQTRPQHDTLAAQELPG